MKGFALKLTDWAFRLPWSILIIIIPLVGLGWLGIARCEELTGGSGRFLYRQMAWSLIAAVAMIGATLPNYRILQRWSYPVFLMTLGLLVAVYFFPPVNNARRWLRLGPLSLQPSELAKLAYLLALARYLMYRENFRQLRGLVGPLFLTLLPVLLVLREPDLGTALVFLPVFFLMLFVAGARAKHLAILVLIGLMAVPLLWSQMSREQKSRVTALFDQAVPGQRPSDDAYHLYQSKQMIALGGGWGSLILGDAVDDPAAYRLPEARSDFIFCVLGERLGIAGMAAVLVLFGLFAWRGLAIASATREPFGRLVATGVVAMIGVEVLINTGMTVGLLPITGLPLPFLSYGGSGLLAHALMVGLLMNIGMRPGYEIANEPFRYEAGV